MRGFVRGAKELERRLVSTAHRGLQVWMGKVRWWGTRRERLVEWVLAVRGENSRRERGYQAATG